MTQKICQRKNQAVDFPKDCQGCAFLNMSSQTPYCTYKEPEEKKTSKKSCCH